MQRRIEVSIGVKYADCFDQISGLANINGISVSKTIGEAVSEYMLKMNNKPKIILDQKLWNLGEYTKEDLLNLEHEITTLQRKVFKQIAE
jgi:hypothetical protein